MMANFKAQMLWENIRKGDLSAVHGLLESGNINLEERDEEGHTFLMVASKNGELNIVRELLEAGVDPNAVDNESWSALLCASKEGHLEIVIELLERNADIEHKDMWGWTALMWASYKGRIIIVQELLDRGANPNTKAEHNMTSLAWAAGRGHTEIVQMLLNKGAKVNTPDKYGTTPLIWACRKGYIEIVDALLGEGAQVDAAGMNSWTPLLVATKGGHHDVVGSLLLHDPNVNAVDKDGMTALAIAAKEGFVEIVKDLLGKGAYVNVCDRNGDSILIHAVKGGQVEVVRALLNKYVDVDVAGAEGKTALYWAVEKGYNEIVRLLLGSEPDLELCTKDEDTAILRAVRSRNEESVRLLLEKGAKVSHCDKRGDTALHIAIRARSKRITELLLRNPRNSRLLYRPNKAGETPYSMDTYHQRGILQQIYGHRNLNATDAENLLGYDIYSGALADILSDPSLTMPITVGLYAKWGSGKSFLINKLQSEMKSFTQQHTEEHFMLTWTVALLALFCSLVVGEALVLGVSLKVGIGVSVAIFVLLLVFFGSVMLCDQRYNIKIAITMSTVMGRHQRLVMLLLRMLFCNPRRQKSDKQAANAYSVRFLFSECTRLTSVGGEKSLAAMIGTLCEAVEKEYGFLVTRLFRVFKPSEGVHHGRFKSFCCVPYFLLVLLVLGCLAAGVALLVQFRIKQYMVVDGVLIAIACILTLTVVGNIVTWAHGFMALLSSQKHRVLNAAEHVETLKMDGFLHRLKHEVELMNRMVMCMDAFTGDQTRLVVIVDGLDSCEQDKVLQVLDTVKSLFNDDNSPFITILAVDPHIIIKGIEHNLKTTFHDTNVNGFDYLRNVVHLPFYLQSQGIRVQHPEPLSDTERVIPRLREQESVMSTTSLDSKLGSRRRSRAESRIEGLSGSVPQMMYASSFDLSNTFARNDYFSDINPRSMRRLMNIVSVTARLLRAYNIDFKWHRLAAWINIIEQWPYRVSWIIYHFDEQEYVDPNTTLFALYKRVLPRIPTSKEAEPLLEIDRNERKLEAFLSSQSGNFPQLNIADLKKFLPCTINLDPYLRKLIRETEHQLEMQKQEMNFGMFPANKPFPPPPGPAVSTLPHDAGGTLGSFRPRVSPMGSPSRLPPGYSPQMMMFGQLPFISSPYNHQTNIVASPARPPPTVFFQAKDHSLLKEWNSLSVDGVCKLIGALKDVSTDWVPYYSKRIHDNNITGLVLQNCDLDALGTVLDMRFGDWQLFKAAIVSLRVWDGQLDGENNNSDSTNSACMQRPSTSQGNTVQDMKSRQNNESMGNGQGILTGPRGRRLRRNDSIVQQLSYEAAILREAVEEFAEETDEGEEDIVEESPEDQFEEVNVNAAASESTDTVPVQPIDTGVQPAATEKASLNIEGMAPGSLIMVLEDHPAPGQAIFEANTSNVSSGFSSFLHEPTASESSVGNAHTIPSSKHRLSLTDTLEKIASPITHALHLKHNPHHHSEEKLASNGEKIAMKAMPLDLETYSSARFLKETTEKKVPSPWERNAFAPAPLNEPPGSSSDIDSPTWQRPSFMLESSPPSPLYPPSTFSVENETPTAHDRPASGQFFEESLQQYFQAAQCSAGTSPINQPPEVMSAGHKSHKPSSGAGVDKESFV